MFRPIWVSVVKISNMPNNSILVKLAINEKIWLVHNDVAQRLCSTCLSMISYWHGTKITSQTPGVSVCWHCSIMFLFMMWTSSSHLTLNSWWQRVGGVRVGCPPPHCSSHLTVNSWWPRLGEVGVRWPPPHCSSHFTLNSWFPRVGGDGVGWGVLLFIAHLTNQDDCSSAVKLNWLQLLYASIA